MSRSDRPSPPGSPEGSGSAPGPDAADSYHPGHRVGSSAIAATGAAVTPSPPARSPRRRRGRQGRPVRLTGGLRPRWPRRLLVGVNVVVGLIILGAGSGLAYVQFRFGQISTIDIRSLRHGGATAPTSPFTMLVVGSDSRNLSGGDNAQFGSASQTPGQRSDTIILVRVVPATHSLSLLSVPRDLWVPIQGMGSQRINAAFNNGPNLLVSTIEADLGIPIDHFVEVNFDTFRQITDAVGGVRFYFPTPARDDYSNLVVPEAGCVTLTGDQALGFVRARHYQYYQDGYWHYEAESDLARIQRQQAFVKKMIKKAESQYSNPLALNDIIGAITKNLTVDKDFSTSLIIDLARQLRSVDAAAIPNETLPTFNETINGNEVLGLQEPAASATVHNFNSLGVAPPPTPSTAAGSTSSSIAVGVSAPSVTINPSSVAIEVANGSGVTGQATAAVGDLRAAGYLATLDVTPGTGFPTNVVRYAPDSEAKASQLRSKLAGGATLELDPALTSSPYNLELITGTSFDGLASSAGGSAGATIATTPSSVAPTSNSTRPATAAVPTTYVLPGTPTGQQPPAGCEY